MRASSPIGGPPPARVVALPSRLGTERGDAQGAADSTSNAGAGVGSAEPGRVSAVRREEPVGFANQSRRSGSPPPPRERVAARRKEIVDDPELDDLGVDDGATVEETLDALRLRIDRLYRALRRPGDR